MRARWMRMSMIVLAAVLVLALAPLLLLVLALAPLLLLPACRLLFGVHRIRNLKSGLGNALSSEDRKSCDHSAAVHPYHGLHLVAVEGPPLLPLSADIRSVARYG